MASDSAAPWGSAFRVAASKKWRRQSAAMGGGVTQAIVQLAAAQPGMRVLDLACGTGEPAISLASHVGDQGRVMAIDINGELLAVARGLEDGVAPLVAQHERRDGRIEDALLFEIEHGAANQIFLADIV